MKTRNRLLAATLTLVMILTMLPISAFAENEPPATGTDVTIESVASDEELTTEETGSPSNPGELPGADEDKEQKDGDGEEKTAESNPTPTSEPTSEPAQGANDETPSVTTFTVSFKSNGGTKIEDQQVESGNAVQEPDAPVKEGFVFDGWYEDATFTVVFDFASPVTSNVILYAKWTEAAPESTPELTPEATDDKEEAGAPDNRDDKEDESAPDEAGKTPDAVIGTAPKGAAPALNAPQAGDTKDAGEVNFGLGRTSYTFPNARVGYGIGNEGYGTDRDHINPKPIIIDNYESEDIEVSVSGGQYFDAKFQGHYNFVYYKKISGNSYDFLYFSPKSGLSKGNYTETLTITAKTYANPQRTSTKTITLSFTVTGPTYPVTVTANPTEGGTVSGDGTYLEDDTATVTATANEGYTFDGWYEGGYKVSDQASYTFTVTGGRSLVAVFEPLPTHSVTLASSPASIGAELEGGGNYPSGTEITVKTGKFINGIDGFFKFEGWYAGDTKVSGDVVYTFTVTGDTSLTAKFKKIVVFRYNISSDTVDLGEGIEIGDIQLENAGKRLPYAEHEKITLTWNGNPVGQWWNTTKPMFAVDPTELGVGTHTLTLNYPGSDEYFAASANITVTVVDTHTVTVTADPAEYGTVTGGGTYTDGESVTVTATSSDVSLYGFAGWYNDWNEKVSEDKSYTFTVTEDVTLTAKFKSKLNTLLTAWDGRNAVVDQDAEFYVSFGLESYGNDLYLEMDKVTLTCRGEEIGERHTVHPNGFNVKASELKFGYNLLKLTYPGSEEYLSSSDEFYVTVVKKLALSLEDFAPETSPLDTPYTVSGRLVDENGDPVVGKSLSAYVKHYEGAPSSKYYSATTGENGVFSFDVSEYVPISPSAINVRFTYSEDDEYKYMETTRTIRFIKGHTVTFEMNGGKWGDPSLATEITVEDGEYIPDEYLYTEPQKDGHMFRGWYKDAACTEYFYGKITEDVTLYAKWVEACEITFDLNGGALTDPASGTTMRWDKGVRVRIASLGEAENYFTPPANHFYIGVEIDGKIYEPGADYALTKDITVKLLWQEKTGGTHTVTFILGDGKWEDTSLDTAITVADGECIPYEYVSAGVTRDGYVFEYNWYTDAACTNEFDVYDTPITADIMLYPEYAKLYAVTTDPNGGTIRYPSYETQQIPEGRGLYVHEWSFFYVNAPDGKIFNGAEINGTTYYIGQTYTVKGDTTVKLLWREPTGVKHTVTFNGNGHGTPSTTSIEVEDGKTLYDALNYNDNSISDNGGWLFFAYSLKQDAASLDDEFKFDTPIIKDIDLYAMWYKPVKITTNSLSGGAVNEAYTAPIEVIAEALLPLEFFKVAWGSLPDGLSLDSKTGEISGTPATAGTFSFGILATDVMRNADMREYTVTITGSSATHIVTVTADPAEGGTVTGDGSFDHGSSVTVKAEPNTDYWFEGWYEGENYLSADEEYTIASLEKDMALTARFAKDCTVTLNMNGGTILDSNDEPVGSISLELYTGYTQKIPTVEWMTDAIEDGSWITAPAGSEYIGAEITDVNGTKTYQPGEEYTVISDATIKVLWKSTVTPPTKHTVTFKDGDKVLDVLTQTVNSGEKATKPDPDPTKDGYAFEGWYEDATFNVEFDFDQEITADTVVYAKFAKEYTLSATVDPAEGGTVTFSKTKAKAGEEVTIKLTLNGGYTLKGISCPVDMIPLNFIVDEWKIVMPENDVTVAVTLNAPQQPKEYNLSATVDPAEGGTVTFSKTKAKAGEEVTIKLTLNGGYTLKGISCPVDMIPLNFIVDEWKIVMPENDVTVAVTLNAPQQPKEYNLSATVDPAEGGTVTFSKTKAKAGEEVTIKLTLNGGYTLKGISCPVDMIPLNFIVDEWKIVMPENDVTVAVTLNAPQQPKEYNLSATVDPVEGGTVTFSKTKAKAGEEVTIKLTLNGGYTLKGISCPVDMIPLNFIVDEWKIVMPENDVTVAVTLNAPAVVTHTVTVAADPAEGGTVTGDGSFDHGSSVTVKAEPNTDYWFEGWYEGENYLSADEEYTIASLEKDMALTARFAKDCTVTLNMNGGTILDSNDEPVGSISLELYTGYTQKIPTVEWMTDAIEDGSWITAPAGSEYIGAEITDANGTKTYQPGEEYTVISDATIKVLWKSTVTPPTKHTVTVYSGNADKSAAEAGETVTLTADAPPSGKEFDKWVVNAGGISLADETASTTTFTMPAANVEVTATYKDSTVTPPGPTTYTVTVNGGTADKSAAAANETVTLTADAPPTGKEFDKWVVNAGGISLADETASTTTFTMPATNVEVTATYKDSTVTPPGPTTYIVTVHSGTADKSAAAANETVKLTADAPPTGKEFDKWVVNAGGISLANENASTTTFTMPATDVEVTATYKDSSVTPPGPTTYTMTFKDGDTVLSTQTVESGQKATKPADPTKDGYTFGGWYADATFSAAFDFDTAIAADTTIYAKFTANSVTPPVTTSTISYNLNGGTLNGKTGTVTLSVENGTTITLPAPTREGYTFDYWEGSRYNAGDSYTVNGDHTFTAQWKKNSTTPGTGDPGKTSPQTGDESNLALWFTMMIASLIAMVLVLLGIRKRKPQEGDR